MILSQIVADVQEKRKNLLPRFGPGMLRGSESMCDNHFGSRDFMNVCLSSLR